MKFSLKTLLGSAVAIGVATSAATVSSVAIAQTFPNKPVTMIVAFPPGGGSDVLGRMVARGMNDALGQNVIVENVAGVGGSMGVQKAANASPDGYTILAGSPLELIYTPLGIAAAKNKPEDMKMAALIGHTPMALAVKKDSPVNTLEEFIAYAKKADKPLTFGSTGIGSLYHLVAEKALQIGGAKGLHVPYNGLAPYLKDLMGGEIEFAVVPLVGPVLGAIDNGMIKAIAIMSPQSIPRLPKLMPTRNTKGFEDFQFSIWLGVQASAKTPEAQLAVIHKAVYASLAKPEVRKSIESAGTVLADPMTLNQLEAFYKKEAATGSAIAKSINLQAQ
jgi:tripartite-type tricarboxylate transporter receptor subunit TctC